MCAQVTHDFQEFRHLQFPVSFGTVVLFKNKLSLPSIQKGSQDHPYQKPGRCKRVYIKPSNRLSQVVISIALYTHLREHPCQMSDIATAP